MSKPPRKGKGPRRSQDGRGFDENALTQLTSKIDKNLGAKDNKRKNPPTTASGNQHQKRQRGSDEISSERDPKRKSKDNRDELLEEIRALGGDERDLELIQDIDSEDDEYVKDSKKPIDKSLKDELAKFSKELGFADLAPVEASDDEVEEEDEVEDEEVDDDGEEEQEAAEEEEDESDDDESVAPAPRKPGDMVSCSHK